MNFINFDIFFSHLAQEWEIKTDKHTMAWNIFHFLFCDKIIVIRKVIVTIYQSCAVLKHIICIIYLIFTILLRFDSSFAKWENWGCLWSEPSIMSTWLQSFCSYHYLWCLQMFLLLYILNIVYSLMLVASASSQVTPARLHSDCSHRYLSQVYTCSC